MAEGGSEDTPLHFNFSEKKISRGGHERNFSIDIEASAAWRNRNDVKSHGSTKREETSLSFRQFLQDNNTGARPKTRNSPDVQPSVTRPVNGLKAVTPDVATGLPDFVQDHIISEKPASNSSNTSNHLDCAPDFIVYDGSSDARGSVFPLDVTSCGSPSQNVPSSPMSVDKPRVYNNRRECCENLNGGPEAVMMGALPDFLSDGPMSSSNFEDSHSVSNTQPWSFCQDHVSLNSEISRLTVENTALKGELRTTNLLLEENRLRIGVLESKLRVYESTFSEFPLGPDNLDPQTPEIDRLQGRVRELGLMNNSLQKTCPDCEQLKSNNNVISQQIHSAASSAEMTLKTLLSGVQSLKTLSKSLNSSQNSQKDDKSGPSYL